MYYILILLFLSVVFFFLFRGKARHIPDTPVKDEVFVPKKKWVFNGILDIDCPPESQEPFCNYDESFSLRVRPGYVHYDLTLASDVDDGALGLYHVAVKTTPGGAIAVEKDGRIIGFLPQGQTKLYQRIEKNGGCADDAYAYVAKRNAESRNGTYFGEVALSVKG